MNWMSYRKIYFALSGVLISVSLFSLTFWGLKLGVEFTGGTLLEYDIKESVSTEELTEKLEEEGIMVTSISLTSGNSYLFKMPPLDEDKKGKVVEALTNIAGEVNELRYENVGPAIGPELMKKTFYAIAISATLILLWVAYQFKNFKYGVSAILAMFHDSFNLIGIYALLGHFFTAEVDFLFVTALLTTLSFSVHDTIVVYDRIREYQKKVGGDIGNLANKAVSETMVRSLNNSFTIIFMLLALLLLGGTTIKWFAVALFIGTVLGTYSSPFVAVPILVTWDELRAIIKLRRK